MNTERDISESVPEPLERDLRRVYRASVAVPGAVDSEMLAAAGRAVARASARTPLKWRVIKWTGVAAAVVAAFVIPTRLSRNSQVATRGGTVLAGDFNRDGLVDILDAFALARAQRDGDPSITKSEIDAAAAVAVRIHRGGGA